MEMELHIRLQVPLDYVYPLAQVVHIFPVQKRQLAGQSEVQLVLSELREYPVIQAEQVVKERQVAQ